MSTTHEPTPAIATNVIDATERFAPVREPKEWTEADIRSLYAPSVTALPFVARKEGASLADHPISFWNDVPSADHKSDFRRGKVYAGMTIEAVVGDKCGGRPLELIFHAIIKDVVARKAKGGKHSRTLPPAVDGFLYELSSVLRAAALKYPEIMS